jgi:cytochrome P450
MLTAMTEAEIDGERLSLDEQVGMVLLLFFAGIETTVFHLTNVCYELGAHPEIQARLRSEPQLIPDAMEEILRYDAPVQGDIRTLTRDIELHGEHMGAGETVLVLFGSANRDPKAFAEPDTLDITRSPNPHLTFAQGVHFCLGAPLVRLEHRIAFEELMRRLPPFGLVSDRVRRRHLHGPFMRGLESGPVSFGD